MSAPNDFTMNTEPFSGSTFSNAGPAGPGYAPLSHQFGIGPKISAFMAPHRTLAEIYGPVDHSIVPEAFEQGEVPWRSYRGKFPDNCHLILAPLYVRPGQKFNIVVGTDFSQGGAEEHGTFASSPSGQSTTPSDVVVVLSTTTAIEIQGPTRVASDTGRFVFRGLVLREDQALPDDIEVEFKSFNGDELLSSCKVGMSVKRADEEDSMAE